VTSVTVALPGPVFVHEPAGAGAVCAEAIAAANHTPAMTKHPNTNRLNLDVLNLISLLYEKKLYAVGGSCH
jgi:hypothetical protein